MDVAELLAALEGAPNLPGAACVSAEARAVFDSVLEARGRAGAAAGAICATCPALQQCRAWLDALPVSQRPAGTIAGVRVGARGLSAATADADRHRVGI